MQLFWLTSSVAHLIAIRRRRKSYFLKLKLLWGKGGYFGMTKLRELLHIFLGSFGRLFYKVPSSG